MKFDVKNSRAVQFFVGLEKKQKILIAIIAALLVLDAAVIAVRLSLPNYSRAFFEIDGSSLPPQRMIALNSAAKKAHIPGQSGAFFRFTDAQKKQLSDFYAENGNCSISILLDVPSLSERRFSAAQETELPFYYGFLYETDFDAKGRCTADLRKRTLSGTDLRRFLSRKHSGAQTLFENGFALEKNLPTQNLPAGLVIYTASPVRILTVRAAKAAVGFDFTRTVPYYGVPSNGGAFGDSASADFSGCSQVFPVQNSADAVMPQIEIAFFPDSSEQNSIKLNAGGEVLSVYRANGVNAVIMQTATLTSPFSRFEVQDNSGSVAKLLMTANDASLAPNRPGEVLKPLRTDPGLLLGSKNTLWRTADYELYEWDRFERILFFDTKDYRVQDDFFRRLAFYVEKAGYKGRILTDRELGTMHGYNAHDYSAESLASFFTAAATSGVPLNEKEQILLKILIENSLIERTNSGYKSNGGAIISISQESADWLRKSLCAHEIWHGLFFTDDDFRTMTAAVYYTIDATSLAFIRGYWASQPSLGYDQNDEYLMHNEFMAYIMQQPLSSVASYFVHVANRGSVMKAIPELCAYVRTTNGIPFEDAARIFDSYAQDRWGLNCGRVALIVR